MATNSFDRAYAQMLLSALPMLLHTTYAPPATLEAYRAFAAAVPDLPDVWLAAALRDLGPVLRAVGRSTVRSLGKPAPRVAARYEAVTAVFRRHTPPRAT